ncbi:MAG: hypothetical protein ACXWUG_00455 [Polyangiales bacterium]
MAEMSMQSGIRAAIGEADELSRRAYADRHEPIAQVLDGLRTALMHVDEAIGGGRRTGPMVPEILHILDELETHLDHAGPELREAYAISLARFHEMANALENELTMMRESLEIRSKPLFGVLPLARVVPQDAHSLLDYAAAGLCLGTAVAAESSAAKFAGAALGATALCVSAFTDDRLGVARVIPIEAHAAIDQALGIAAIAAPFALGYWKKDPAIAALHVITGASVIVTSLFTDYRASRGLGRPGSR